MGQNKVRNTYSYDAKALKYWRKKYQILWLPSFTRLLLNWVGSSLQQATWGSLEGGNGETSDLLTSIPCLICFVKNVPSQQQSSKGKCWLTLVRDKIKLILLIIQSILRNSPFKVAYIALLFLSALSKLLLVNDKLTFFYQMVRNFCKNHQVPDQLLVCGIGDL